MNFDSTLLILSLIPSGVGVALLMYGRKQQRWPQLVCGVLFLAYPYFTETVFSMIGVGLALGIGLYAALAAGW